MSCTPRAHEPSSMCDGRVRSLGRFALAGVLFAAAPNPGVTQQPPPTFSSGIDLVTIDVVVVDKAGRPVRGLTPRDFEVEEDGSPQAIVSFEAVVSEPEPPAPTPGSPPAAEASHATRRVGRAFAVVLDDLGLDLSGSVETRRAASEFLRQSLGDGDEVIVGTTSGDAWWSGRLPEARDDLLAVVARLRSRRANPVETPDFISDYEAFQINKDDLLSGQVLQRVVTREGSIVVSTAAITLNGNLVGVELDGKELTRFNSTTTDVPARKQWYEPKREYLRPTVGYIGLQTHDPGDIVYFREVSVRPLEKP